MLFSLEATAGDDIIPARSWVVAVLANGDLVQLRPPAPE
jgi:hypothetical protein